MRVCDTNAGSPFHRTDGKKPTQMFVLFDEKALERPIPTEPLKKHDSRFKFGMWVRMRNSAEGRIGTAGPGFAAYVALSRKTGRGKEAINRVMTVLSRRSDGRWFVA